jgi:hypothetical protein
MMKKNKCARRARTALSLRAKAGIPPDENDDFTLLVSKVKPPLHRPYRHDSLDLLGVGGVSALGISVQATVR